MTIEELNNLLHRYIHNIDSVVVSPDFIDYREFIRSKFRMDERDDLHRIMHADCLILERELIHRGYVDEPLDKVHDICVQDSFIDLKCVTGKYFNISEKYSEKIPWWKAGIKNNILTHFSFYRMNRPSRPLKVNDIVSFEHIKVYDATYVLSNLKPSKYSGYYFEVLR